MARFVQERGALTAYRLDKRGRPTLVDVVVRAATGVFNQFSYLSDLVEEHPEEENGEGGALPRRLAKKPNGRQRILRRRRRDGGVPAGPGRAPCSLWRCFAMGLVTVVLVLAYLLLLVLGNKKVELVVVKDETSEAVAEPAGATVESH